MRSALGPDKVIKSAITSETTSRKICLLYFSIQAVSSDYQGSEGFVLSDWACVDFGFVGFQIGGLEILSMV